MPKGTCYSRFRTTKYLSILAITLTFISYFISYPSDLFTFFSSNSTFENFRTENRGMTSSKECKLANENTFSTIYDGLSQDSNEKYAYVHCIDLNLDMKLQLYGILAFHGGLMRTKSKHHHIVLVPKSKLEKYQTINTESSIERFVKVLQHSISSDLFEIIEFDTTEIEQYYQRNPNHKEFRDSFHRIHVFNSNLMSKYDKILIVEYNMLILSNNIDIVFNSITPSAPPERWSGLESNMACFLFSTSETKNAYGLLLKHLADDVYVWYDDQNSKDRTINENQDKWTKDSYNSEKGTFQSLVNAVFWRRKYKLGPINQLHHKFATTTNKLSNKRTKYFIQNRKSMFYMIEMVDDYPPTKKARDRCMVRTQKMINDGDHINLDWFEVAMNEYFVQFWLDLSSVCDNDRFDDICEKLGLSLNREKVSSKRYFDLFGYPYPTQSEL